MYNQKMKAMSRSLNNTQLVDQEEEAFPGFRFHPTDQELVGFYLRRKVDKKPLNIDLIKQIDIYKYDPWDLPHIGTDLGDKEWYFFCRRGRKYRNSIRPNRVTGSGFWKATGIDRPIYNSNSAAVCVGLKKSLVYYRGSAGKGTKTEWMMHEFRLPPSSNYDDSINIKNMDDDKSLTQEAEVLTLCRILKRSVSHRKRLPADWSRELSAAKRNMVDTSSSCTDDQSYNISFQSSPLITNHDNNSLSRSNDQHHMINQLTNLNGGMNLLSTDHHDISTSSSAAASSSSFSDLDMNEFIKHGDWDDLRSVVEFAATHDGPVFFM